MVYSKDNGQRFIKTGREKQRNNKPVESNMSIGCALGFPEAQRKGTVHNWMSYFFLTKDNCLDFMEDACFLRFGLRNITLLWVSA